GLHRLTAAHDRYSAACGKELRDALRPGRERGDLEYAHRSVPEDRLCAADLVGVPLDGARTDVDDGEIVGNVVDPLQGGGDGAGLVDGRRAKHVDGQQHAFALHLRVVEDRPRLVG